MPNLRLSFARRLWPSSFGARVAVLLLAGVILALSTAAVALADTYWNVWQNNLPSGGVWAKHTPYGGSNLQDWELRLSWTSNTHDMNFLVIDGSGRWHDFDAFSQYEWNTIPATPYDRWMQYDPHQFYDYVQAAGCANIVGDSTVWVNCRNAGGL